MSTGSAAETSPTSTLGLAVNPFPRLSKSQGLLIVLVVLVAGLATSRLGVRFDGLLDVHVGGRPVPLSTALADQFVAVPLAAGVAWIVARMFRAHAKLVELLIAIGVARVPTVFGAPIIALLTPGREEIDRVLANPAAPSMKLLLIAALALPIVAWHITLLVFGLRHATALRGGRLAAEIVATIVLGEIASKLALFLL